MSDQPSPFPSSSTSRAAARSRRATSPTSRPTSARRWSPRLGLPGFRAKQLSTHYFSRLVDDPAQMTDLPAAEPRAARRGAAARPDDAAAHARGRQGHHPQDAVEAVRRRARRVGADALPRPRHDVRVLAGRLRHGLPVLRDRPGRPAAQHVRPPRSSSRSSPVRAPWRATRSPGGPGRVSNVVFMGMGEPMANYKAVIGAIRRMTDKAPDGLGMSARGITRLHRRPGARGSTSSPTRASRSRSPCRCTPPTTSCATSWCRSTPAGPCTRRSRRPGTTRASTKRRVCIEYAMMCDINDQAWRADLLGDVLTSYGDWGWVHVNLIPLNPTPGLEVDRVAARGRARVRAPARGQGRARPRSATPAAARSTAPAASSPRPTPDGSTDPRRRLARASRAPGSRCGPRTAPRRSVPRSCQSLAASSRASAGQRAPVSVEPAAVRPRGRRGRRSSRRPRACRRGCRPARSRRDCCGQSMCAAVLTSQKPPCRRRGGAPSTWLRCVWPLTQATTFGVLQQRAPRPRRRAPAARRSPPVADRAGWSSCRWCGG